MNICQAIEEMKGGRFYARPLWGHRVYLYLDGDVIQLSSNGYDSPWQAPHPDLMADDWEERIPSP